VGVIIKPYCTCGFTTKEIFLGGGMDTFESKCIVPFYCVDCKCIYSRNIFKKTKGRSSINVNIKCNKCKSHLIMYGVISEFDSIKPKTEEIDDCIEWSPTINTTYYLKRNNLYCPICEKHELKFDELGLWD
jgi:hypothetical protein